MLKKVARALDEMAKNEELMQGILAAAEDDDNIAAAEGRVEDDDYEDEMQGDDRLNTIGEDKDEEGETKGDLRVRGGST
jgi:hypothetical protein